MPFDGENGALGGLELKTWKADCGGRRSGDISSALFVANGGSVAGFDGEPFCKSESTPRGFAGDK